MTGNLNYGKTYNYSAAKAADPLLPGSLRLAELDT